MNAHGFAHKYGNNVDTDVVIPARYLKYDPQRVQYKMQVKSYSTKPEHTIGY